MSSDTVLVNRYVAPGVVKARAEILGDGAVKNELRPIVPTSGVTIAESGSDQGLRSSFFTFTKAGIVTNWTDDGAASFGTVQLGTFPKGRIRIHDVSLYLTKIDGTLNEAKFLSTGSGDFSLGTVATTNVTLDGTNVNLAPSAAMIDPFVTKVGTSNVPGILAATAAFDGTTTAVPIHLNFIFDVGTVLTANGTVAIEGKLVIKWAYISDF